MKTIDQNIKLELERLDDEGLRRSLTPPCGIDFSSNDYLGLAGDQRLKDAAINAISNETVGSTGSRLLRGERALFASAEKSFANWKGTEGALYFATGYQANIGVLQTFLQEGDAVFSDSLNHASLIDGIRLGKAEKHIYPHLDYDALAELLDRVEIRGEKFVVTESLFSMDGDIADLERIVDLCERFGVNLIVDEAHAVGIFGETGSGLIEKFDVGNGVFLSVNTAGKALGASGAFVSGNRNAIEYLINKARSFIFSTAPMPASAAVIGTAIDIIAGDSALRDRLKQITVLFREFLQENGVEVSRDSTHIVPIIIGDSGKAVEAATALQSEGFDVRAIRPPTVAVGTSRLRISLNTKLQDDDLERLAASIKKQLSK